MKITSRYYKLFNTYNPSTGELQDADSLPTATIYKNAAADDMTLTVANISTGLYSVISATTFEANEFAVGDRCEIIVSATVEELATMESIETFSLENDITAADVKTAIEAEGSYLDWLKNVQEGDSYIDTTTTPWQIVVHKKGDPTTEYSRKDWKDADGEAITGETKAVYSETEPE